MMRSFSRRRKPRTQSLLRVESLEARQMLTTVTLFPSQDATLYEDPVNDLANGIGPGMFVGNTNAGLSRRALLKFDIGSQIPEGASINDVRLTVQMDKTDSGPQEISLHALTADWGEGSSAAPADRGGKGAAATPNSATWKHRKYAGELWDSPGGDFLNSDSASVLVGGVGQYDFESPSMIDEVADWVENPENNFGWIMIGNESGNKTAKRFGTRESGIRPVLTVDFDAPDFPQVTIEGTSGQEGDTSVQGFNFAVTVSKEITAPITLDYEAVSDTAMADEDFDATSGQLVFNPGDPLTKEITIFVRGDLLNEEDESFSVMLTGAEDTYDIMIGTAVATIENDDPLPTISVEGISIDEGDEGMTEAEITFTLSEASGRDVFVQYIGQDETAEGNVDYVKAAGQVNFEPGETSKTAIVLINGDLEEEDDETFALALTNPNNAELEVNSIQVTILDDDFSVVAPWQNSQFPEDVSNDGIVAPIDALLVINDLNQLGARPLPPPVDPNVPPPFLDVDGDGFVAPLDALRVINYLNNPPVAARIAEPNAATTTNIQPAHAAAALADMFDEDADEKRRKLDATNAGTTI